MDIVMDNDLQRVVEFMQANLPTAKLIPISECIPKIARLLWEQYPQQPCNLVNLLGHRL